MINPKDCRFYMPDGTVLYNPDAVDAYYNLGKKCTLSRLKQGWSTEACARNMEYPNVKSNRDSIHFYMPDGSIFNRPDFVDKYYNLEKRTTVNRLRSGWSKEECARNTRYSVMEGDFIFYMPDGSILTKSEDVDNYENVEKGTTRDKIKRGEKLKYDYHAKKDEGRTTLIKSNKGKESVKVHNFKLPDGTTTIRYVDIDNLTGQPEGTTAKRLAEGWTVGECVRNGKGNEFVFYLPNGDKIVGCSALDRALKREQGTTERRLALGWNFYKCMTDGAVVKADIKRTLDMLMGEYTFNMPDGSVLKRCDEVDAYYDMPFTNITELRLQRGWTEDECANNKPLKEHEVFKMPKGQVLYDLYEIDAFYGLKKGTTGQRLKGAWSRNECVHNSKNQKHVFILPNGKIITGCSSLDKELGLKVGVTNKRISLGWTEEECVDPELRKVNMANHKFILPDGRRVHGCVNLDRELGLEDGTTEKRLADGWTFEECIISKKKYKYRFRLEDGTIITSCSKLDKILGLREGTTSQRLHRGWTPEECVLSKKNERVSNPKTSARKKNKSSVSYNKYIFKLPDDREIVGCTKLDEELGLRKGTTTSRLSMGWTQAECINPTLRKIKNVKTKYDSKLINIKQEQDIKYDFKLPNGKVVHTCDEVDLFYGLVKNTTYYRINNEWTVNECADNMSTLKYAPRAENPIFTLPNGDRVQNVKFIDKYTGMQLGTTLKRLKLGWSPDECIHNSRNGDYMFKVDAYTSIEGCEELDKHLNLKKGTTAERIKQGWSLVECTRNNVLGRKLVDMVCKLHLDSKLFTLPSGIQIIGDYELDRLLCLGTGTTAKRLQKGWTEQECVMKCNKTPLEICKELDKLQGKLTFLLYDYNYSLPNGHRVKNLIEIDKYYNLPLNLTLNRMYLGWSLLECVCNSRMVWE